MLGRDRGGEGVGGRRERRESLKIFDGYFSLGRQRRWSFSSIRSVELPNQPEMDIFAMGISYHTGMFWGVWGLGGFVFGFEDMLM